MEQIIIDLINKYGYLGIFGLITIENLFPPIPSEVILTAGGFMTTCSSMTILGVALFSTFGSVLGAIILYLLGSVLSQNRILQLIQSPLGRILHFHMEDILRSIDTFRKKGKKAVFLFRFVPIMRSLISLPAGMCKMDPIIFLVYTTLGSLGWNLILVYIGSIIGLHRDYFYHLYASYSIIIKILLGLYFLYTLVKMYKKHKKTKI